MGGSVTLLRTVNLNPDTAASDAFSRLRVSSPEYVFDASFEYDLQPLLFEQTTAETGATVTHEATDRAGLMTFSSTPTGGKAIMQTYEYFRYQPGRSHLVLFTFNFIEAVANVKKFAGYSDGNNGPMLELDGTTVQWTLYSDTAKGDETVVQADWNIDTLDGSGDAGNPSGLQLDLTKTNIGLASFQWLGVGRVQVGFDLDGVVVYCHEFMHAGFEQVPYSQTANLPIRWGMTSTGTVSTTMRVICCSVISEGGQIDVPGYGHQVAVAGTGGNSTRAHIVSLRPKTTFNSIANRSRFVLEGIDVLVTGNTPVLWELVLGQAITGDSYGNVNADYSGMEFSTAGTLSGSPGVVIASGHIAASNQTKSVTSKSLSSRYPVTLGAAGAVRALGTLTLLATGLGATSTLRAALAWREIR